MVIELKTPSWEEMSYIRWLWGDEETMEPVGGPILLMDDQASRWFRKIVDPGCPTDVYKLILNEKQQPVGEVSFHQYDKRTGTAMFNIKIASSERGNGYARAAMRLFLDKFFNDLDGRMMKDDVAIDNLRGQEVLIRFGFVHDPSEKNVFSVFITKDRFNLLYNKDYQ
jgi:RimJ/RimL family protein N-acetyltransferase